MIMMFISFFVFVSFNGRWRWAFLKNHFLRNIQPEGKQGQGRSLGLMRERLDGLDPA